MYRTDVARSATAVRRFRQTPLQRHRQIGGRLSQLTNIGAEFIKRDTQLSWRGCRRIAGALSSPIDVGIVAAGADRGPRSISEMTLQISKCFGRPIADVDDCNPCFHIVFWRVDMAVSMASPGYGDPLRPDPQAVLRDVRDGLVSPERDRSIYGVVIRAINATSIRMRQLHCGPSPTNASASL